MLPNVAYANDIDLSYAIIYYILVENHTLKLYFKAIFSSVHVVNLDLFLLRLLLLLLLFTIFI